MAVLVGEEASRLWGSPSGVRVLVAGAGCSKSSTMMSSCVLVEHAGAVMAVDCPHPATYVVAAAGRVAGVRVAASDVGAWVVSHAHADHCSGLESAAFHNRFELRASTCVAAALPVVDQLRRMHEVSPFMMQETVEGVPAPLGHAEVFDTVTLALDVSTTLTVAGVEFVVSLFPAKHTVPTFATRVDAAGHSVALSSDSVFDLQLSDWLSSAELFGWDAAGGPVHAEPDVLADSLSASQRRRCMLLHRCDGFDAVRWSDAGFLVPGDGTLFALV